MTGADGSDDDDCPVCGAAYDSLSVHEDGLVVNLLDNDRYRRVCFDPAGRDGTHVVEFYHHTHEQVAARDADGWDAATPAGVDPEDRRGDPVEAARDPD